MKRTNRISAILILMAFCASSPGQGALFTKGVLQAKPELFVSGHTELAPGWEAGFESVYETLFSNLHLPRPPFKTRYAYPSPMFKGVYLWDTAFTAQVWKPWDVATAQEITISVLDHAEQGRLPHFVSLYGGSDLTQPPVMAWSVWELYSWSGDREYLARAYPALKDYNRWLYENRRLGCGLFFWKEPYESGIDNSPRFGSRDESEVADMPKLAAVDLCSYLVLQNEVLAEMARVLGNPDDAAEFEKKRGELRALVNTLLWDPETGLYYDRDTGVDRLIKTRTIASLLPLFCGVPEAGRAGKLRDHIMDPEEFNTLMPLPSVARNDPSFEKDCWRGPVWINTAYMVVAGLERYGYHDEAAELSFRLVDGVYKNHELTGKLVEFYDPDGHGFDELHRKRGNLYKKITLGDKPRPNFVGWTGLANTLVIEYLIGFHKGPGKRWLAPRFPDAASGAGFTLSLPGEDLEIELWVLCGGKSRGIVKTGGTAREFSLSPGMSIDL